MSEYQNCPLDFTKRTLELVKQYKGDYEATLLVNCLLALLMDWSGFLEMRYVLREDKQPPSKWKPFMSCVEEWGTYTAKSGDRTIEKPRPQNFMCLIRSIRNSLIRFHFEPIYKGKRVKGFCFRNENGFAVNFTNAKMREFAETLAPIAEKAFRNNIAIDEYDSKIIEESRHEPTISLELVKKNL